MINVILVYVKGDAIMKKEERHEVDDFFKREARRRRRIRNQIIAYVISIVLLIAFAFTAYIGVKEAIDWVVEKKEKADTILEDQQSTTEEGTEVSVNQMLQQYFNT